MGQVLEQLNHLARQSGFISWAVIPPDEYTTGYHRLLQIDQQKVTPFVSKERDCLHTRVTPKNYCDWARSVLMLLYPYGAGPEETPAKPVDNSTRGKMARIAWGEDYHLVVGRAITNLADDMVAQGLISNQYWTFIDTSPFSERELAYRSGLGYPGRNNCLINNEAGSFVIIGGIVTATKLPEFGREVTQLFLECNYCAKCIDACPGNALKRKEQEVAIDLNQCVAYLTVEKGIVPREKRPFFGDYLYGCDICQIVCPVNKSIDTGFPYWGGGTLTYDQLYPSLRTILALDNQQFRELFSDHAIFWRGRTNLQRNALIVAGNIKSVELLPQLQKALEDQREVIRAHAIWAIEQIFFQLSLPKQRELGDKFFYMNDKEKNAAVLRELEWTLANLEV